MASQLARPPFSARHLAGQGTRGTQGSGYVGEGVGTPPDLGKVSQLPWLWRGEVYV